MMEEAYRNVLLCYMERQYVTKTAISEIDPSNKTWFLPKKNVYVGIDVMNEISKPIISEMPTEAFLITFLITVLEMFFERCQLFYSCLCVEIRKRYDFDNFILPKLQIFVPKNAVSSDIHQQFPSLAHLLQNMTRFYDSSEGQLIDEQWRLLPDYRFTADEEKKIDINEDIDIFWGKLQKYTNEMGVFEFQKLSQFVLNILSLPHSNAECERVFSKINLVKTKSRNKLITNTINGCLLTSQCVKKDGNCVDFTPTQNIIEVDEDEFVIDG
ncbi:uncharacterized protein LOC123679267 isoform X3 [Harmonia axyridis]|uniref:uncharacterized protein LOC123679267 isoform X3 n=1 Tax=Harmonia axyridis TaxID=115357 RepID=UPI001E2772D7|nr:uncharacterized protein LOC123679267 isoform X3 [Harmonia axyridis]